MGTQKQTGVCVGFLVRPPFRTRVRFLQVWGFSQTRRSAKKPSPWTPNAALKPPSQELELLKKSWGAKNLSQWTLNAKGIYSAGVLSDQVSLLVVCGTQPVMYWCSP